MTMFRAASLRAKLFAIVIVTIAALLLSVGAMTVFEFRSYRQAMVRDLLTLAHVVGANSTAALKFNDQGAAEEILRVGFSFQPRIVSSCLYDKAGRLFAAYRRPEPDSGCPPKLDGAGVVLRREGYLFYDPVFVLEEPVGTLRLSSHLGELERQVQLQLLLRLLVLLSSSVVALLVAARLQRIVSVPVLDLARTAKIISERRDYTLRASKLSDDEVGSAVDAFNQMLQRIEQADQALRRAGEQSRSHARILQSVLDNMGEGMAVSDDKGSFLIWNPAATRLLGKGPTERGPQEWPRHYGLYRPGDLRLYDPDELPLVRAQRGEQVTDVEILVRPGDNPDGRWISATARPLRDDQGAFRGGVVVFRDVTERKAAEEQLRALNATLEARIADRTAALEERATELKRSNEELEAFAYVASHDLQEPLRAMASYAQLLKRLLASQMSGDANLYSDQMLAAANRMRELINALLDYSRVGREPLARRTVPLEPLFDTVLDDLSATIADSGARVTRGPLPVVAADPVQLGQLFRNLVSNAIKFHGKEAPVVDVHAALRGDQWQFTVSDNGIGIDRKHFERIFVIFQRLHGRECAGTGIGLAVCKKIVERHGGQIWLESEPGKGSTFTFSLPALAGASSPAP
jgi:signal transduction histidine kinase